MIAIILDTKPEIIKMFPIIRECEAREVDYFILHTGQHYSYEMDRNFFEELELPDPKYNLEVGSGTHADQTGQIMAGIETILMEELPDTILVQGDTNAVLAAAKLHIRVGNVEAGLQSFDWAMPEESCILDVPCVTLRENTERPETVEVGANVLAGAVPDVILSCARKVLMEGKLWTNPFEDGKAGEWIVRITLEASS